MSLFINFFSKFHIISFWNNNTSIELCNNLGELQNGFLRNTWEWALRIFMAKKFTFSVLMLLKKDNYATSCLLSRSLLHLLHPFPGNIPFNWQPHSLSNQYWSHFLVQLRILSELANKKKWNTRKTFFTAFLSLLIIIFPEHLDKLSTINSRTEPTFQYFYIFCYIFISTWF